jgi:UPF0716 protein FxsA
MVLLLVLLFLVLPVVELWVTVQVAQGIGVLTTVALMVLMSVTGVWLVRRQGASVWRRANAELAAGRVPAAQLLDGVLVVVGGVALVLPGFVTGVVGLLLLLPPVRALVRPLLLGWMGARAARAARSGRVRAVFMTTSVGSDGPLGRPGRGDGVIDAVGWDVGTEPPELGRGRPHRPGPTR